MDSLTATRKKLHNHLLVLIYCGVVAVLSIGGFFGTATYEAIKITKQLSGRTGVLARVEGIESQVNAVAINTKLATSNIADATTMWKSSLQAQLDFANHQLPGLVEQFKTILAKSATTISDADALVVTANLQMPHLGKALDSISTATDSVPGAIAHVTKTVDSATDTINDLDQFLNSAQWAEMQKHGGHIVSNMDEMTTDADAKFHAFLYPPPCKGKWCWAVRSYNVLSIAGHLAEPAYWGVQTVRAVTQK